MKLAPLCQRPRPSYPAHRRRTTGLVAWARRVAAVTCAAGAVGLAGCYGASPFGTDEPIDEVDEPFEPAEHLPPLPPLSHWPESMAGGERAPGFQCDAPPEWYVAVAPTYLEGSLCGEGVAWAEIDVASAGTFTVRLASGADYASVTLLSADDAELALLDADGPEAVVDLAAGTYRFAATALDPVGNPYAWIGVSIDYAG